MKSKKEIKAEYKQLKFRMGVFQIRNLVNNKVFISSSLDLDATWNSQRFQLNAGLHSNAQLQKEWQQYGAANFTYETLEVLKPNDDQPTDMRKELLTLEKMLVEELQPFDDKGYNRK